MNTITFSNPYIKLRSIHVNDEVTLLEVFLKHQKALHASFIEYDTVFFSQETFAKLDFYKLPEGELLVLLFEDFCGNIFTTVRNRYGTSGDKLECYTSKRGEKFKVICL